DEQAINILISILADNKQEAIVRHEAAEALGAIGSEQVLPYLQKYKNDPVTEVAETCELAIERIHWLKKTGNNSENLPESPYSSVDPAPPSPISDVDELKLMLLSEDLSLFQKYRAMFALRNLGTKEAVTALGEALTHGSALFKHEIAFVLGQMQKEESVSYLRQSLEDVEENEMVRHECA
nr:nero [Cucujiformia]